MRNSSAGNSITLSTNTTAADGGVGQFAIGTFTADAASQVITFSTVSVEDQLNGFQLRQVPEPATLALLGLGLAGLGFSRRKKA